MTIRTLIAVLALFANSVLAQGTVQWTWTTQTGTPFQCSFDTSWDEAMTPGTSWNNDPFIRNSFTITDAFGATLVYDGNSIEIDLFGSSGNPLDPNFDIILHDWHRYTEMQIIGGNSGPSVIFQQNMADGSSQGSAQGYWTTAIVPEPTCPALLVLGGFALLVGQRVVERQRVPFVPNHPAPGNGARALPFRVGHHRRVVPEPGR
jgi:hypothetical protein